jgi:hypothetical protein
MMNQPYRWMNGMNGWTGGGMWIWTTIPVLAVFLLIVLINNASKKES